MTKEEAIEELKRQYLGDSERIIQAKKMAIESLENQKTGHWERKYNIYTLEHWYKCSECGDCSDYKTPYCSDCGAKMEGGTE